jgi:outer membrane protein OmpA-like peptidoglycan-associated protein
MQRTLRALVNVLAVLCVVGLSQQAFATGFQYKVDSKVQTSEGYPSLMLQATDPVDSGTVHFKRSDGKSFSRDLGSMKRNETKTFSLKQPAGTFSYKVKIKATGSAADEDLDMNLEFDATLVAPLKLSIDPDSVQVSEGKAPLISNRPIDRIDVEVYDSNGKKLHAGTQKVGGKKGRIVVKWPASDDVGGIRIKAHDVDDFWSSVLLEPFWVEIPHDKIIFNFGKATWDDSEEPKLKKTLADIREAMKEHAGKGLQMQLYIAGYTDTVGSKAENMKLSTSRARAIAGWFQKNGLDIPIYYQGFGESVLEVQTPDETEEEKNRRAVYILGNARPPTSSQIPKSNWKQVK